MDLFAAGEEPRPDVNDCHSNFRGTWLGGFVAGKQTVFQASYISLRFGESEMGGVFVNLLQREGVTRFHL